MNSFTLTAVGNLARNPELVARSDTSYTRFCLVGNDYAGKDEGGTAREVTTSIWFTAFGLLGESLARNARKGDQLIVEAHMRANNWTDKQGEKQYDHSFVHEHYASFTVAPVEFPQARVVLVDDVVTKGRTLLAAAARVQMALPHADIRAFALIRTLGFARRLDSVFESCHGVIRWAAGDAWREP